MPRVFDRIVLVALVCSCSTQNNSREDCTSDDQCVTVFGAGSRCAPSGFCEASMDIDCAEDSDCDSLGRNYECGSSEICEETTTYRCETSDQCMQAPGEGFVCSEAGVCENPEAECATNPDCRALHGYGSVCSAEGSCETVVPNPRCTKTFPDNLYERLADFNVVIGNLMDRTVPAHLARERAAELAVNQANDNGGIDPAARNDIGIVFCTFEENTELDELERADAVVASAQFLFEEVGAPVIVGPSGSNDTQTVFTAFSDERPVMISPSATSPFLTALEGFEPSDEMPGFLWRTAPPDSLQGLVIAEDLEARMVDSIAVIWQEGPYGDGLLQVIEEQFSGMIVDRYSFNDESSRDLQIAAAAGTAAPELIFISSQEQDAIAFLNAAGVTSGFDDKRFLFPDAAANLNVAEGRDPMLLDRIRGTRPAPASGTVYNAFLTAFATRYSDDASNFSFTPQAYDAAWLAVYGAAWSYYNTDAIDPVGVAQGLRSISSGDDIELIASRWPSGRAQLMGGNSVNLSGASGELDYDPTTEETESAIDVWVFGTCGASPELTIVSGPGAMRPACM